MDIIVTFRHMEPSGSLKNYAEEKISKIDKYFDFPTDVHIVMTVEKFRRIVDVTLNVNGTTIKGLEETEDMYSSIDKVMDKIEVQVKRFREKTRQKRSEGRKNEGPLSDMPSEIGTDEPPRIEIEKLAAKPMDPEEAAMQFTMSQQDFLVFRNSRSCEVNVIYKRKDGNLGLIEPSN